MAAEGLRLGFLGAPRPPGGKDRYQERGERDKQAQQNRAPRRQVLHGSGGRCGTGGMEQGPQNGGRSGGSSDLSHSRPPGRRGGGCPAIVSLPSHASPMILQAIMHGECEAKHNDRVDGFR